MDERGIAKHVNLRDRFELALQELIRGAIARPKPRKPSQPSRSAKRKRLESKTKRSQIKAMRGKVTDE